MKTLNQSDPDVEMINYTHGLAIMDDGEIVPIVSWMDDNGDETPEHTAAVVAVAGPMKNDKWLTIDLSVFTQITVN